MPESTTFIICRCKHTDLAPAGALESLLSGLQDAGIPYQAVDDFCGLAANEDERLGAWGAPGKRVIVGCYERAMTALFAAAQIPLADRENVTFLNLRTDSPQQVIRVIAQAGCASKGIDIDIEDPSDWIPWFPVIDRDRCQNCKLCMNFCLFGVYALSPEGQVTVTQPRNCKTNCPACARVCPAQAIIFPKYAESPINGDQVPAEASDDQSSAPGCVNALLEGNVYDLLRKRSKSRKRFSTDPATQPDLLHDLHKQLGIPLDVLTSLSPTDLARIQTKANVKKPQETTHD